MAPRRLPIVDRLTGTPYLPNSGQDRFHRSSAFIKLGLAGIRGGKTCCGGIELLKLAEHNAPFAGLVVSPTYDMLKIGVVDTIRRWWPDAIIQNNSVLERASNGPVDLKLVNGVTLYMRSGEEPDHIRGLTAGYAWIDEPGKCSRYLFDIVVGRVSAPCQRPCVIMTGTPAGMNSWLFDIFGKFPLPAGYDLIRWSLEENATNLGEGYLDNLRATMHPLLAKQEIDAEFIDVNAIAFLPADKLVECEREQLEHAGEREPIYVGIDVGRENDLFVIWSWFKRGDVYHTHDIRVLKGRDFATMEAELYDSVSDPRVRRCSIDATGMGMQFAERAAIKFPGRIDSVRFTAQNKEQIYGILRRHVEEQTIRIPRDPTIRADLMSLEQEVLPGGGIRLRATRSSSGHADRCCAAALGLYAAETGLAKEPQFSWGDTPYRDVRHVKHVVIPQDEQWCVESNEAIWQ